MTPLGRVTAVGGGPAGLLTAVLLKESSPGTEVVVLDRDPVGAADGFGVVFSASSLAGLSREVPWLHDDLLAAGRQWDDIEMRVDGERLRLDGNGFAAVARSRLLEVLRRRARRLGVDLRYGCEVRDPEGIDADLVLGADGVGSRVRETFPGAFLPSTETTSARFVWFGAYANFTGMTFLFERTAHGWFAVHGYPYDVEGRCTFLVETDPGTWSRAGATDGAEVMPGHSDTAARDYCAATFAQHLVDPELLQNNSVWRRFTTLRTESWSHDRYVLLGDAAHTAHFSVGSGTTMALQDAIALAGALRNTPETPAALRRYEAERRPSVERLQAAAAPSLSWWENFRRYMGLPTAQLGMHFLSRSGRVTHERARRQDPAFVAHLDQWFSGGQGVDAVLDTPFAARGWHTPRRTVRVDSALGEGGRPARPVALCDGRLVAGPDNGVPGILVDDVRGPEDVHDRVERAVAAVTAGSAALVAVRAAPDAGDSGALAAVHVSELLRLDHQIPTVLVAGADPDHAAQLVLSGRADLVALEAPRCHDDRIPSVPTTRR